MWRSPCFVKYAPFCPSDDGKSIIVKGPPNCWLVPGDTETYNNDHRDIASTLMDLPNGIQFGPKAAVCGGYEGGSDNKYYTIARSLMFFGCLLFGFLRGGNEPCDDRFYCG